MNSIAPKFQVDLFEIGTRMRLAGLADNFVAAAIHTAMEFDGVYDLVLLWDGEDDAKERDEIIADIQDMVDDCVQAGKSEAVYIRFDDLDSIAKNVRKFKDELLMTVNQHSGITELAKRTGIPQPSLSRFFNTHSMPRRGTLLKIAKALDLDAVRIATEWVRE
ncbi:MAG: helix-turn-helix transcriptional regulator [Deltaproteobacteria bacterium]|nr:helix-turn-helix transcriptional regulator [Deltaproteobacteria bacterium]